MRAFRHIAVSILGSVAAYAFLVLAGPLAARAEQPACEAKPITAARKTAQARRDAGDPAGAFKILKPFVDLACPIDADAPAPSARQMLSDYAWLIDDAYANGADKRFGRGQPDSEACIDLLQPLANEDLVPHKWMSPALRQATIANIKACAADCIRPSCAPFRAQVWSTYRSEDRQFRDRACAGGGQQLAHTCLEIRPGKAGFDFAWKGNIKGDFATPDEARDFCPALYRREPGAKGAAVRLELPEASALRDGSTCCAKFGLKVKPGTDQFVIVSGEMVRDCYGGTAEQLVEEIYRLPPGAGQPILLRNNDQGVH